MDKGQNVTRTVLIQQPGQTVKTLAHGPHPVTGGEVHVGFMGSGHVTIITGITVDNCPATPNGWIYRVANQPFNKNFAKVLYEIRAAGQQTLSYTTLDGPGSLGNGKYSQYLLGLKHHRNMGVGSEQYGETRISSAILNALAEQEG